jgi:hypothetical protein
MTMTTPSKTSIPRSLARNWSPVETDFLRWITLLIRLNPKQYIKD